MKIKSCLILVLLIIFFPLTAFTNDVYFYHTDNFGTPMVMTDAAGEVVWQSDELPFGEEYETIESPIQNNRRYLGKELDEESGLIYMGARFLDPATGRFNQPDPVGLVDPATGKVNQEMLLNPQRQNRYVYGLNNPYKYVDPDGEFAVTGTVLAGYGGYVAASALAAGIAHYGAPIAADTGKWLRSVLWNENAKSDESPVPDATPGRKTKGKTTQWEKSGGIDAANKDFDNKKPANVRKIPNGGRVGDLPDGKGKIIVRPNSSDGRPTLETQEGKRKHKVRYED